MKNESQTFGQKLKKWMYETFLFLTSWVFIRNLLGILTMFAVVFLLTFWWMDCYTRHGKSYPVEDFTGMVLPKAQKLANEKNFNIVVSDSLFLPGKPPNTVLSQNPIAQSMVKKNRKIYLTVTKSNPDKVAIPDLTGGNDDYNTYRKKLNRLKVNTRVKGRKFSNKLEPNTILEVYYNGEDITQKLRKGFEVDMGSTVEVIVTERKGGRVPIPNLICMPYNEVEFLIKNQELNIGSVIEDATVTDRESAYIWRQIPAFNRNQRIAIGTAMDIHLTQFKPDNCQN